MAQQSSASSPEPWNDPGSEPHVRITGVSKVFDGVTAVDNITLDIYQGEFFSLLGPSGCGKTTLLRLLAGFESPSSGRILLDGSDLAGVPPYRRPVNMMFQSYALFPHMNVVQNIGFGLRQEGLPRNEIVRRVEEVVALVQLSGLERRKPHQLSGGQCQRVALARSLVKKPKLLLLDEPLGALDKKLRQQTQFELMNIQEQLGITFVIVTHDQEEAMTVSTRIAVMNHGVIAQVASPAEIYETPASRYVADFIGEINLLEGHVIEQANGTTHLDSREAGTRLVATAPPLRPGTQAWLAIRPEKLFIDTRPPADRQENCVVGEVLDIGYLGKLSVYHVKLGSGKIVTSVQTNRQRSMEPTITWNDSVYLSWPRDAGVVLLS